MGWRWRDATAMAVVGTVIVGAASLTACSDDEAAVEQTLPAIQTTSTPPPTTVPPTTTQPRFYEIQQGDTLVEIAAAFGLPVEAIMQANAIVDPNRILAGQILTLPLASEIVVTSLPPAPTPPTTATQATAAPAVTTAAP